MSKFSALPMHEHQSFTDYFPLVYVHVVIGDVRGRGLMLGVELVTDRQLKTPAKVEIVQVMEHMKGICSFFIPNLEIKLIYSPERSIMWNQ